ncbi:Yip1 family protein [Salidesulfovibrio onnuriiensis]|uniref:Yip1 family protein n=1 Tax=Salidesulfovibrio onnuriiensis TaxID=2583823 RepID=UPI0011C8CD6E|nr:Yip1 family protein [Salidesulfovibrio onnuriiensis]
METTSVSGTGMNIREYFETLFEILRSPARHFERTAQQNGPRRALFFLMVSSIFYCSVSMTYFFENSLVMGGIMLVNSLVMPALGAAITSMLLGMTWREKTSYGTIFNIYAYASGAVMVVSWIPGLAMVMEPVRAVLVGIGLVKAAGVGKLRAALLVACTAVVLLLLFWTAAPLVVGLHEFLH